MKKKLLPLAVAAGLTGMVGGTAQAAMHINEQGTGQALIYPFYSAEGGNDTYFHIVNTSDRYTKAVKVRFIEAKNSTEVLDFNLYLSPEDMWTGTIRPNPNGDGAIVRTRDNSCTVPQLGSPQEGIQQNVLDQLGVTREDIDGVTVQEDNGVVRRDQPFVNFEYAAPEGNFDAGDTDISIDRTREGYIEVIEMGYLDPDTSAPGADAVHTPEGVPADCGSLVAAWNGGNEDGIDWLDNPSQGFEAWGEDAEGPGGLYGYGVVINVADGTAAGYDASAIEGFADSVNHEEPGDAEPSLANGINTATIFDNGEATNYSFADSAEAVSALFMAQSISNDYVLDPAINARTDWVVTMPTKRFFVTGDTPVAPFTDTWDGTEACELIDWRVLDREEAITEEEDLGPGFSPPPPQITDPNEFQLCTEVSLVQFGSSSALHGSGDITYPFDPGYDNGWARMSFDGETGRVLTGDRSPEDGGGSFDFTGLPVVGFAALNYQNGDVGGNGVLANYAATVEHKSERLITPNE